jgi:Zn-finger nucleic acid-binding protein
MKPFGFMLNRVCGVGGVWLDGGYIEEQVRMADKGPAEAKFDEMDEQKRALRAQQYALQEQILAIKVEQDALWPDVRAERGAAAAAEAEAGASEDATVAAPAAEATEG